MVQVFVIVFKFSKYLTPSQALSVVLVQHFLFSLSLVLVRGRNFVLVIA